MTQRLLAAGYPLGGDLSAGGFRSENIISLAQSGSAQDAVDAWMGDAPHQNTMLSQALTEIGAGVAVVNGRVYYVIDCARPTNSGELPAGTQVPGAESTVPVAAAVIYPVGLSTPNADGEVIHEVRGGQTLWQIAISYGVKINDIKSRNNILGNDIYPGNKLLIKIGSTPTALPPTSTVTVEATMTSTPSATTTPTLVLIATQAVSAPAVQNTSRAMTVAFSIIALALVGGVIAWLLGSLQNPSS
jgi:LysM repeat protein